MRYTELQIGNIVLADGEVARISSVTKKKIGHPYSSNSGRQRYVPLREVHPIPITEEWLFKNGATVTSDEWCAIYTLPLEGFTIEFRKGVSNTLGRDYFVHIDNADCQGVANADVQYIHQFQNLLNLMNIKFVVDL